MRRSEEVDACIGEEALENRGMASWVGRAVAKSVGYLASVEFLGPIAVSALNDVDGVSNATKNKGFFNCS